MFYLDFLKRAVDPRDHVTREFIESMLPGMMEHYADLSAKGGDHSRDSAYDEEARRKFAEKHDQSMLSHQLNGIFPTMRLLNVLENEDVGPIPFSDTERRVYILSYLMHDVDKIVKMHGVETGTREDIERAKDLVAGQLRSCNVAAFFPDFAAYLEDIVYLVVNTQQMWGTHLHTYNWRLQLKERRIAELRRLCTYSDQIAYLVTSPSAILGESETRTLTTILNELSDDTLAFTYHQLREVRGLLTNVINNGLVNLFTQEGQRAGIWPYLFFSDGVVYIQRKTLKFSLTTEQIVETVQAQLRKTCGATIKSQAPGFKFDNKGLAKHPGYYFEFLSLEDYLDLLARFTIARTANGATTDHLEKLRQMQAKGEIAADLPLDFPLDKRIGILSRFFSVVFASVLGMLDKKQESLRRQVEQEAIKHLELERYWAQALTIPGKGGVEYRWFWLAACYLRDHPGITEYEGRGNLYEVFSSTMRLLIGLAGDELRKGMPQQYLYHLTRYLDSVVELPLSVRAGGALPDFAAELERYESSKGRGRKLICTLCNSAYPAEEQTDNAVLFQPWVYKNKLSLHATKNAGGICSICSLEMMLRQILQKGLLRLTGGKFEALKTKYLAVYPNFFFTAETGALVQGILNQLCDINFFTVRKQLNGNDITVDALLRLDVFNAPPGEEQSTMEIVRDEDDENEGDEQEGDEEQEEAAAPAEGLAERSYIKFEPTAYPGLCFFGMKAGKDSDDTSSWAMPAFLALALPLVTNTKVVVSEMALPLFTSGHDFRETVIFDAPHPYLDRLLKEKRMRVNQLLRKLNVLASIYRVNLDTYADKGKPNWKYLSSIARDLNTDPLFLFSYLKKQQRGDSLYSGSVDLYIHIFEKVLEEDLSIIQQCVDRYTVFYRGGYQSHSILKPVDIVAKAIIKSPLELEKDDLLWQIQGELKNWLDRVRARQAAGYAVFRGKNIDTQEAPAIHEFVRYFYEEVFERYCQGERGILRSRLNRFKDGCEACYVYKRNHQGFEEHEEAPEESPVV